MSDIEKQEKRSSVEVVGTSEDEPHTNGKNFHFDEHDLDRVQRRLQQRHVQM